MEIITLILVVFTASACITWSLLFIPLWIFKIKIFKIKERSIISTISKKIIDKSFIIEDNEKPSGFFFSLKYVGYVHTNHNMKSGDSTEIYILTKAKIYNELINFVDDKNINTYNLFYRRGNYFWLDYASRTINLDIKPSQQQQDIINKILKLYNNSTRKCISVYIHGKPGCGKSTIPILLALNFNGSLCKSYNPTDPGDNIDMLFNQISPSASKPLILVFEEVDIWLKNIHEGIRQHKHIPTQIKDKSSWNMFFDDLKLLYPNLILIMTSNLHPEIIDKIDSCYLRQGRIDKKISML